MKISRNWLQDYFEQELPSAEVLADALTFHAFEIDGIEREQDDDVLDVKITPNRGHDCLSHRGVAKEISAILELPMKKDPFKERPVLTPHTHEVILEVDDTKADTRHVLCLVRGVETKASPEWLVKRLASVGQRSINNIVDITNFVLLDIGLAGHAFDYDKLTENPAKGDNASRGKRGIRVRRTTEGESIELLGGMMRDLPIDTLVLSDAISGEPLDIAGIKGGTRAELTEDTKNVLITTACFDGPMIRKTSQKVKIRTDASQRFEQVISPEFPAYGVRMAADMVVELAGGTIEGFIDMYPEPQEEISIDVSLEHINGRLGTQLTSEDVANVFKRLDFNFAQTGESFAVQVPFERLDLTIPEDLTEEVVRVVGYDTIAAEPLPAAMGGELVEPTVNQRFFGAEKVRAYLAEQGFSEVFTSVFAESGERVVANKVDGVRPYLRKDLFSGLSDALAKNVRNKDLLGLQQVKIFEIGTVWTHSTDAQGKRIDEEKVMLALAVEQKKKTKNASDYLTDLAEHLVVRLDAKLAPAHELEISLDAMLKGLPRAEHYEQLPIVGDRRFAAFSKYPFITRDIAMWVPAGTEAEAITKLIKTHAGELLMRVDQFDRFEKEGRVSYAFRLIFQSFDRTLFDEDANERMVAITNALKEEGFEIR